MLSNQARVKRSFIIFKIGLLDAHELQFFKMEDGETFLVADIFQHTRKFLTNDFGSFHNGRPDRRIVMLSRDRNIRTSQSSRQCLKVHTSNGGMSAMCSPQVVDSQSSRIGQLANLFPPAA